MRLVSSIVDVERLRPGDRGEMHRLMIRSYANVRREAFDADLAAKQWVIQVRDQATGKLAGFSTQAMLEVDAGGRRIAALYSGDTVVDRRYWGDTALASAWGQFALELAARREPQSFVWFLTSKGFRTYRYLPLFFRDWHPRVDAAAPGPQQAVIDALGRCVAPHAYDPTSHIIRANAGKDHVRPELADPRSRPLYDRHVRFFLERNPGHARGDELCCVAPLCRANFTRAALRVVRSRAPASVAG